MSHRCHSPRLRWLFQFGVKLFEPSNLLIIFSGKYLLRINNGKNPKFLELGYLALHLGRIFLNYP